ncbi:MAG: ABC transporter substrate-binding protein [Candidatus Binatia bacterium]
MRRCTRALLCALTWQHFLLAVVSPASAQQEKMIVGYSAQAGAYAPIWITKEAGLFRKNGLDVNLVFIPGGPTAAAAMIANEVQAMAMAGPAIVSSNLAGSDLVMTAGIVNTFAFQLVAVKSITSANQLKGKRIGVNRFGAAPDVAARYALNHLKIDPREVTILQLGEQSTRLGAMKAGQLDAAILLPPITTIAQKDGMNVLLDMSELGGEFLITGMASSQKFLTHNKSSAIRLMRALVEGIHYFKTQRRESEKIIARYMRTDNLEAVGATWEYFAAKIVPRKPYPSVKGVKALLDLAAKERPEAAKAAPERFINTTLLKELDDSGFIDGLYR